MLLPFSHVQADWLHDLKPSETDKAGLHGGTIKICKVFDLHTTCQPQVVKPYEGEHQTGQELLVREDWLSTNKVTCAQFGLNTQNEAENRSSAKGKDQRKN